MLPFYIQLHEMPTLIYNHCAFIHVPKTAGVSITIEIEKYSKEPITFYAKYKDVDHHDFEDIFLDHATAALIEKYEYGKYNKMVAFVRNPYTRFISMYCQAKILGLHNYEISIDGIKTFCQYRKDNKFFMPMKYFIYKDNKCLVDYILRFENFENDIKILAKIMNIHIDVDHLTKANENMLANNKTYIDWYSEWPGLYHFVNDVYKEDFELFGYELIVP